MSVDHQIESLQGNLIDLSMEQAAGGKCSLRTLHVIGEVSQSAKQDQPSHALIYRGKEYTDEEKYWKFDPQITLGNEGELVTLPSDDQSVTRLGYKHHETGCMIELWRLMENSADTGDCSYAVFVPALHDNMTINYSLVVTREDENRPATDAEALAAEPRTNAKILDSLMQCLKQSPNSLAEDIKIDELIEFYGIKKTHADSVLAELSTAGEHSDPLTRQIGRMVAWAQLGKGSKDNKKLVYAKEGIRENVNGRLEVSSDGTIQAWTEFPRMGKNGRLVLAGTLKLGETDLSVVPEVGEGTEAWVTEHVETILGIPEVVVDPIFQEQIRSLIAKTIEADRTQFLLGRKINEQVSRLLNEYRHAYKLSPDTVIDMGVLDVQSVGRSEDGTLQAVELFCTDAFSYVKASVLAHSQQRVFMQTQGLYECRVIGAASAFGATLQNEDGTSYIGNLVYRNCVAENVGVAFESGQFENCIASGGEVAFVNSTSTGCIADRVRAAFNRDYRIMHSDTVSATDCLAIDADEAFGDTESLRCIAEHCGKAFRGYDVKESEARNPRNLSWSFYLTDTNRRTKNKITGRIIGKGAAKLRGRYDK